MTSFEKEFPSLKGKEAFGLNENGTVCGVNSIGMDDAVDVLFTGYDVSQTQIDKQKVREAIDKVIPIIDERDAQGIILNNALKKELGL